MEQRSGVGVVLDTNQWFSTLLLRTPTAAALLHHLTRAAGAIALPEVVERELRAKLVERGSKASQAVKSGMSDIQRLLGSVREWDAPSDEQFAAAIADRLEQLAGVLDRVPLRHEHTLAALDRVVHGVRPTVGEKEEFRDQLVWQAVLEVARTGVAVIFVTADGGFYEAGKVGGSPATPMVDDVADLEIRIVKDLEQCLDLVAQTAPPIDRELLVQALLAATAEQLRELAEKHEAQVADLRNSSLKVYATERADVVAAVFQLERNVHGLGPEYISPTACVEGTALFDGASATVIECRPDRYGLRWLDENGEPAGAQNVVLDVASVTSGPRDVPWTVRRELPGS